MKLRTELTTIEIEIEDAVFILRELDTSTLTHIAVIAMEDKAASLKPTFLSSVIGWRNVRDESGEILECTDENKALVFEANMNIAERVAAEIPSIGIEQDAEKKI